MDNKKDIKKELEEIAPFLAGLEKESGFKVPENYFKQLEDDLWDQLQPVKEPIKQTAPQPSWLDQLVNNIAILFQPQMALRLATVALLIVGGLTIMNWNIGNDSDLASSSTPNKVLSPEEITQEEAALYIAANLDDFDTDLLMELEEEEDLTFEDFFEEEDLNNILDNIDDATLEELL